MVQGCESKVFVNLREFNGDWRTNQEIASVGKNCKLYFQKLLNFALIFDNLKEKVREFEAWVAIALGNLFQRDSSNAFPFGVSHL